MNKYAEDVELSPEQLDDKYNPEGYGQHPEFTRVEWQQDVAEGNTLRGYWEWVESNIYSANIDAEIEEQG